MGESASKSVEISRKRFRLIIIDQIQRKRIFIVPILDAFIFLVIEKILVEIGFETVV